jgi:TolB-like protein
MWWRLVILAVLAVLILVSCVTEPPAQASGLTLQTALNQVANAVGSASLGADPVSVVSFRNINPSEAAQTKVFGEYFADSLLATLKSEFPKLKIVERTELDKILQERQYSSEGFLTDENLKNLAPVLPARFVMTGQFTVFPHSVQVNSRLLDVRTGEVVVSKIENIVRDDNVASLLGRSTIASEPSPGGIAPSVPQSPRRVPVKTTRVETNPGLGYSVAFGGGYSWLYFNKTQNFSTSTQTDEEIISGSQVGWDAFIDLSPYFTLRYGNRDAWDKLSVKDNWSISSSTSTDATWNVSVSEFDAEFKIPVEIDNSSTIAPKLGLAFLQYSSGGLSGVTTTSYWKDLFSPIYMTLGLDLNYFFGRNVFLRTSMDLGFGLNSDLPSSDYSYYGLTSNSSFDVLFRAGVDLGLAF